LCGAFYSPHDTKGGLPLALLPDRLVSISYASFRVADYAKSGNQARLDVCCWHL
jgi:hypothetical protein